MRSCRPRRRRSASMIRAGRDRGRAGAAGHAGRARARRRRRPGGVLHADRRRHRRRRGQGGARLRRQALHPRDAPSAPTTPSCRRYQADAVGNLTYRRGGAELRAGLRHGRQPHDRRGEGDRPGRQPRSRGGGDARHLRRPHRADHAALRRRRDPPDHHDGGPHAAPWRAAPSRAARRWRCRPT